jgi:hypothetical protein
MICASENIIGMDVDPTEWDPELFIPCQVCHQMFILELPLLISFLLSVLSNSCIRCWRSTWMASSFSITECIYLLRTVLIFCVKWSDQ